MATTTFQKFSEFPSEISLEVWRLFLEDEARDRRVVVWDGRVMPFAHLASPLLSVNVESLQCALSFYPVKVNIYSLNDPDGSFPCPHNGLRTIMAEVRDAPQQLDSQTSIESDIAEFLANIARTLLNSAELVARVKGALYLKPEQDTILHGHNCGLSFFERKMSDLTQGGQEGLETLTPFWQTFSSKVPTSFYKTAKRVLRVLKQGLTTNAIETKLTNRLDLTHEEALLAWWPFPIGLVHPILRLEKNESDDLLQLISSSNKQLIGEFEAWMCWKGAKESEVEVQDDRIFLVHSTSKIKELEVEVQTRLKAAKDFLDELDVPGENVEAAEIWHISKRAIEEGELHARNMEEQRERFIEICAHWQKRWA
ncbi:hypothetical protein N0V93_005480 [Gnomoniopsis smithogilvyi]|uniref:Uncharacterized protein n=1 Tax=Gnomoniopsis smithogilvyi TaxID=1191159 RepID=A0A9W8YUP4_9PEZI|nr:hypothetical protein N0V93_005480 [Gnomoniopsis smithogilvyi]